MNLKPLPEIPDDKRRIYALLAVALLEALAVVALDCYVDRVETLPSTLVPCRHAAEVILTNFSNVFVYGSFAQRGVQLTNVTDVYWIGPVAHAPETNVTNVLYIGPTNQP